MLIDCLVVGDIDIFWERQVVGLIVLSVEGCFVCDDGGGREGRGGSQLDTYTRLRDSQGVVRGVKTAFL